MARKGVPAYKVAALAGLREMEDLGITQTDIRHWLTPRQIQGYWAGRFLSGRQVPNIHRVALNILQSKELGRRATYRPPTETPWWVLE